MKPTILEVHCLDALCDDYENIQSIQTSVSRTLTGTFNQNQIANCILRLLFKNWAVAYQLNESGKYGLVVQADEHNDNSWFLITDLGREILNENWTDGDKKGN